MAWTVIEHYFLGPLLMKQILHMINGLVHDSHVAKELIEALAQRLNASHIQQLITYLQGMLTSFPQAEVALAAAQTAVTTTETVAAAIATPVPAPAATTPAADPKPDAAPDPTATTSTSDAPADPSAAATPATPPAAAPVAPAPTTSRWKAKS